MRSMQKSWGMNSIDLTRHQAYRSVSWTPIRHRILLHAGRSHPRRSPNSVGWFLMKSKTSRMKWTLWQVPKLLHSLSAKKRALWITILLQTIHKSHYTNQVKRCMTKYSLWVLALWAQARLYNLMLMTSKRQSLCFQVLRKQLRKSLFTNQCSTTITVFHDPHNLKLFWVSQMVGVASLYRQQKKSKSRALPFKKATLRWKKPNRTKRLWTCSKSDTSKIEWKSSKPGGKVPSSSTSKIIWQKLKIK